MASARGGLGAAAWREVRIDSQDAYNTWAKWVLVPFLVLYSATAVFGNPWTQESDAAWGVHNGRDSGLRMKLNVDHMPPALLKSHAICAIALVLAVLFQKYTIVSSLSSPRWLCVHRWVGRMALAALVIMDIAGFLMGPYSAWESFGTFEYIFAAPWVALLAGIYFCAQRSGTLYSVRWHRYFGNALLKACIATPAARLAGSAVQRGTRLNDEQSYYAGIGGVAAAIGCWQLVDTVQMFKGDSTATVSKKDIGKEG